MPRDILLQQFQAYPQMQPQDAVKLLFQRQFGAEHALGDSATVLRSLQAEYASIPQQTQGPLWEAIGGGMCRVQLSALDAHAILPGVLGMLFITGAQEAAPTLSPFVHALSVLQSLADSGAAPFSSADCAAYLAGYAAAGYPAVSHSDVYRAAYRPAYRVLPLSLAQLLPLCSAISRKLAAQSLCVLTIDGRCGAGKTSLAALLQKLYQCSVIKMDDFFLPQELRTVSRLQTPGSNIHYERFSREISAPLSAEQPARYRGYHCARGEYGPEQTVFPRGLVVIEGSYSLHPACQTPADLRVFLTVSQEQQRSRLQARESPASYARFLSDWIPLEEAYFQAFQVEHSCDFVIDTTTSQQR